MAGTPIMSVNSEFGISPEEIVSTLKEHVYRAELFMNGALIIVTDQLLDREGIQAIDGRIRPLIQRKPYPRRIEQPLF